MVNGWTLHEIWPESEQLQRPSIVAHEQQINPDRSGRFHKEEGLRMRLSMIVAIMLSAAQFGSGQAIAPAVASSAQILPTADSEQTARILGLEPLLQKLAAVQSERGCGKSASLEELTMRQQLVEQVQAAALDVDGVLAEIANEQGQLSNLRTSLQARRDKTVAKLNTAALITGSAAGAAVSATQFNTLGSRTNNIGDGFGIGAGVASTIFSVMASRKQNGPSGTVGEVPNMLAPLFGGSPVLNTYYAPAVLQYLQTVPGNEDPSRGTRIEQLKALWIQSGRLEGPDTATRQRQIAALTSSSNPSVNVSIRDLLDRIAMLVDVSGRVSLMKRDLAVIRRSYMDKPVLCTTP